MKLLLLAILYFILLTPSQAQARNTVTFAIGEWAPFITTKDDNGLTGELVRAAMDAVGMGVKYECYPWKRSMQRVIIGETTASFPWSKTDDWEREMLFSAPLISTNRVIFYRKNVFPSGLAIKSLRDLSKFKAGTVIGYWHQSIFTENNITMDDSPTLTCAFKKLQLGRVDIVPSEEFAGWAILKRLFPEQIDSFAATTPFARTPMYAIFSRSKAFDKKMLQAFNQGLAAIMANGTYDAILKKHGMASVSVRQQTHAFRKLDGLPPSASQ